jgi:hypothetical protein
LIQEFFQSIIDGGDSNLEPDQHTTTGLCLPWLDTLFHVILHTDWKSSRKQGAVSTKRAHTPTALIIVVASCSTKFGTSHLGELIVEMAITIPRDDAL